ncbi:hypothetical protein I6A84_28620, partial [Frankia sp. CNm7]
AAGLSRYRWCAAPGAGGAAHAGDLGRARRHLARASEAMALWDGTAWQAAMHEAEAHLALGEGDPAEARARLTLAARLFEDVGHPLDAARCADTEAGLGGATSHAATAGSASGGQERAPVIRGAV